jgi:hypothetical protein
MEKSRIRDKHPGSATRKKNIKKFSSCKFFLFFVIKFKTLDPDPQLEKMLDPDPH